MTTTKLDLAGLKCPLPALKTRKALKTLPPGDRLEVLCTDPLAVIDIPNLIRETGDRIEITERSEGHIVFLIEKSNGSTEKQINRVAVFRLKPGEQGPRTSIGRLHYYAGLRPTDNQAHKFPP